MTAPEFEARIVAWARKRPDIDALVLGGSRAKHEGGADKWSDWDFHLFTSQPKSYYGTAWLNDIASCLSAHSERTPRGVTKVSAVFADGLEADFVPLAAWQMKLLYWAMRHPGRSGWMPNLLVRGIQETQGFMLGSGYRLLVGDSKWNWRFEALKNHWPQVAMSAEEYARHVSAFWTKAVWVFKKIARPEPRSAMHWLHLLMMHHVYVLLAEEARLAGRVSRSEARKAEKWLDPIRLQQSAITTGPDQVQLARALQTEITLFRELSESIANSRGFTLKDHSEVQGWLRSRLLEIAN